MPDGPVCPFCGQLDIAKPFAMKSKKGEPVKGWYHCKNCRKKFTVRPGPMGGEGKTVEVDETYIGNAKEAKREDVFIDGEGWVKRGGGAHEKMKVVSLVERDGKARSVHVHAITANSVREVLVTNADRKSDLRTDEANVYRGVGTEFASHRCQ